MLGPSTYQPVPVVRAWDETHAFRAVALALPAPLAEAHQRPGQVVKVRTAAGEGFFALASAPAPGEAIELLVKRGGKVADALATAAAPGGTVELTAPFGKGFPVEEAAGRDVLLFAAGSGIAPVRALVQHLLADRARYGRATLFYGQRHGAEFAYRDETAAWRRAGVQVVLCPSQADEAWDGVRGRVQEVARSLGFGGHAPEDTVGFVCGMKAMVEDVRATLATYGVPPNRVHANF